MKKTRFSETKIVSILKRQEAGVPTAELCREYDLLQPDCRQAGCKAKYGGLGVREVKRLKEMEAENAKLKKMYAETSMENYALKELIENPPACLTTVR